MHICGSSFASSHIEIFFWVFGSIVVCSLPQKYLSPFFFLFFLCAHLGSKELCWTELRSSLKTKVVLCRHLLTSTRSYKPFFESINYSLIFADAIMRNEYRHEIKIQKCLLKYSFFKLNKCINFHRLLLEQDFFYLLFSEMLNLHE